VSDELLFVDADVADGPVQVIEQADVHRSIAMNMALQGIALEGRVIAKGIQVVYEFGDLAPGLALALADPEELREPDLNARIMQPDAFGQLIENIRRENRLESLPFCTLDSSGQRPLVHLISGTQRKRAAKAAGLGLIPVLVDLTPMSKERRIAKQIAHNAIQGSDDLETLRQLVGMVQSVDLLVESFAPTQLLAPPEVQLEPVLAPSVDIGWKAVAFAFLPHQIDDFAELLAEIDEATLHDLQVIGVAPIEQYDRFVEAVSRYAHDVAVKNSGTALALLIRHALAELRIANGTEHQDKQSNEAEWTPLSRLLGRGTVPPDAAAVIAQALDRMEAAGEVSHMARWQAIEFWAAAYLAGSL
jgi:hypothetical protein